MDLYKYQAAFVGETKSIIVTHKATGRQKEFNNRTEFYGHHSKKAGGWLAERNKERDSPFTVDEFVITDKVVPDKIDFVLHTAKTMVETDLKASGAKSYKAFLGEGESFRVGKSTIVKYKDRDVTNKPFHLDAVTEYLEKKFRAETVTDIEADDVVVIECFGNRNNFALIEDKDYWGQPIKVWDRNQQHRGVVDCNKFGHLFLDDKGKIRGEGRIFLYWQIAYGDDVDTYWANSASDIKWGEKSAYKALKDCTNDQEAWTSVINTYKMLYPEPKVITGWRQDPVEIDWKYVLEENATMARMLTSLDDSRDFKLDEYLNKLGVSLEY